MPVITINYTPRPLQRNIHDAIPPARFGVLVTHRRFGKTVLAVNHLLRGALTCVRSRPRFGYIGPTYRQSKAVAWDYLKFYSDPIPRRTTNESELRVDYPNDGQVRLYGADNPDSLRGLYFDGVVLDEYGLHPPKVFTEVIAPALSDRGGWALFIGTPNGKNQFYDMHQTASQQQALQNPDWFYALHKASETGYVTNDELARARAVMTQDEYDQEYECSFEASVKGAVYANEITDAKRQQRITRVPIEPMLPVDTDWDLGLDHRISIWFSQSLRSGEVRLVDYYEGGDDTAHDTHVTGLPHYAQVLRQKGYTYGTHWAPHDIQVREFASGRSRLETAASLGIHFQVVPQTSLEDGIHAARMLFPKCWFDAEKCAKGIEALQHYRWDYNSRIHEFKPVPVHDFASHGADAYRGLACRQQTPTIRKSVPPIPLPTHWMG